MDKNEKILNAIREMLLNNNQQIDLSKLNITLNVKYPWVTYKSHVLYVAYEYEETEDEEMLAVIHQPSGNYEQECILEYDFTDEIIEMLRAALNIQVEGE